MEELVARLDAIQRLLVVLLSDPRYRSKIEDLNSVVYREFDEPMNKLFPSDAEYRELQVASLPIKIAINEILIGMDIAEDEATSSD